MAHKKFGFEHILAIILAVVCTVAGTASMFVIDEMITAAKEARAAAVAEALAAENTEILSVPASGMNVVLNEYASSAEGSAVDYLTTTAVASGTGASEYVNSEGTAVGKFIVCTAEDYASVYEEPFDCGVQDSEEASAEASSEIARIYTYGLATLISIDDEWCYIISDGIVGYVQAADFAFAEDAEALDESTYITSALISEDTANLYELANSKSTVLCILKEDTEIQVLSDTGYGFLKVYVEGVGEGYVVTDRTETVTERTYAVSVETIEAEAAEIAEGIAEADELDPSFIWPLPYYYGTSHITSYYGYRYGSMHRGIDIYCPSGTSIYAVMDGTVVANYYNGTEGYAIVIYHGDGLYTLCFHMCKQSSLAVGTSVKQGDVIGYVGSTGRSTGSHLHFAVGIGGYTSSYLVNPASYLGI